MLIFLDSNIFYNNWQLRNANFTLLFNYIKNSGGALLVSELVIQEVEAIEKRERLSHKSTLEKSLKAINNMNHVPLVFDAAQLDQPYHLKKLLAQKLDPHEVIYFDYNTISQKRVVSRAINVKRPFKDGEKGYRDTLIWLSFLSYLKRNKIKTEVAFINNNSDDFLNTKKDGLNPDLEEDILAAKINCSIKTYKALPDFISEQVDKQLHAFSHSELNAMEPEIEQESVNYINGLTTEELRRFLNGYDRSLGSLFTIIDHSLEIDEGIEDPELIGTALLAEPSIYINYKYWLRICTLSLTVATEEYQLKKSKLDFPYELVAMDEEFTQFEIYIQLDMTVSFAYHMEDKYISGFVVDYIRIR